MNQIYFDLHKIRLIKISKFKFIHKTCLQFIVDDKMVRKTDK